MSRFSLTVGSIAVVVVAVIAVLVLASTVDARTVPDRRESQTGRAEYTVASVAAAEARSVAGSPLAVAARRRGVPALPDTLTLVVVGSLLIGLAAAVRRTT